MSDTSKRCSGPSSGGHATIPAEPASDLDTSQEHVLELVGVSDEDRLAVRLVDKEGVRLSV